MMTKDQHTWQAEHYEKLAAKFTGTEYGRVCADWATWHRHMIEIA